MLSSLGKAQKGCSLQVKENSGRSLSRVWVNKEEEEKWPADRWKQNTSSAAQRAGDRGWEGMSRAVGLSEVEGERWLQRRGDGGNSRRMLQPLWPESRFKSSPWKKHFSGNTLTPRAVAYMALHTLPSNTTCGNDSLHFYPGGKEGSKIKD